MLVVRYPNETEGSGSWIHVPAAALVHQPGSTQPLFRSEFTQSLQNLLRLARKLLDHPGDPLELGNARIAHALIQPALARRDDCAFSPQPRQRDRYLLWITTTHAVCKDINLMPLSEQIQGRLRDADMALDAHDDHLPLLWPQRVEGSHHIRHHHRKGGLVNMCVCLDPTAVVLVEAELSACLSELGARLCCRKHRDVENRCRAEEFLRCGDHARIFMDRRSKFLLQVADAVLVGTLDAVGSFGRE